MKVEYSMIRSICFIVCLALVGCGGGGAPNAVAGDMANGVHENDLASVVARDMTAGADMSLGADMSRGPDMMPSATCGGSSATYTLLSGADTGLIRDNTTGLVWMRDSVGGGEPPQTQALATNYCTGRAMRLPTKAEALNLAAHYAACAFGHWSTWTSTATPIAGDAWVVDYTGGASPQVANNFPSAVLCVR
jgi:hypothetical protein